MYRGRGVPLSSLSSLLSCKQTLSSLLPRKKPYILSSSLPSRGVRSALFGFKMEEEARLFLMTDTKLLGIRLRELMELGKEEKKEAMDWESLASPPFDFCANVPGEEEAGWLHHFVLDSKLYSARGGWVGGFDLYNYLGDGMSPPDEKKNKIRAMAIGATADVEEYEVPDGIPRCRIYQLDMDNQMFVEVPADSNSIPPLPTPFCPSFLGNIPGHPDVYCLVYCHSGIPEAEGLWVLSSSSSSTQRLWKRLPPPPPLLNHDDFGPSCSPSFVFQGKVFLDVEKRFSQENTLFSFDPTTAKWAPADYNIVTSFDVWDDTRSLVTLSLNNRTVGLSGLADAADPDYIDYYGPPPEVSVSVPAFLVNNENGGAGLRYRSLHECFSGVQPSSFDVFHSHIKFADLGNGMVCALLYAFTPAHDNFRSPVLCMSVFTLSMVEPAIGTGGTGTGTGTEAPRKEREDLSVEVHGKRAFTLKEYDIGYTRLLDPFVFTPKK